MPKPWVHEYFRLGHGPSTIQIGCVEVRPAVFLALCSIILDSVPRAQTTAPADILSFPASWRGVSSSTRSTTVVVVPSSLWSSRCLGRPREVVVVPNCARPHVTNILGALCSRLHCHGADMLHARHLSSSPLSLSCLCVAATSPLSLSCLGIVTIARVSLPYYGCSTPCLLPALFCAVRR